MYERHVLDQVVTYYVNDLHLSDEKLNQSRRLVIYSFRKTTTTSNCAPHGLDRTVAVVSCFDLLSVWVIR